MSYRELDLKGGAAGAIPGGSVGELESRVGIYLPRSVEMMIGVLGVMKAGGAYVPLEPGLPPARVEYMLEDAGIEWVLVESGTNEGVAAERGRRVLMDGAGTEAGWLGGGGRSRRVWKSARGK